MHDNIKPLKFDDSKLMKKKYEFLTDILFFGFYSAFIMMWVFFQNPDFLFRYPYCPSHEVLNLFSTPQEIVDCFGLADIGSYVRGALAFESHGFALFSKFGFGTWPPGFSILEFLLIKFSPLPLPLSLFLLTSLVWAGVLNLLRILFFTLSRAGNYLSVVLPIFLLMAPFVNDFYLSTGILMSEPLSMGLFLLGALEVLKNISNPIAQKSLYKNFIVPSIFFALSIYMRAQFDLVIYCLLIFTTLIYIFFLLKRGGVEGQKYFLQIKNILIVLIISQLLTVPYKYFMASNGHGFAMANVSYIFGMTWRTEAENQKNGAKFFSDGGGSSMCLLNPTKCNAFDIRRKNNSRIDDYEYRDAAIRSVILNPIQFFKIKFPYFWESWKSSSYAWDSKSYLSSLFNILLSFLIFVVIVINLRQKKYVEVGYFLIFSVGIMAFCWLVHFEARYLLPIKMVGLIWILFLIVNLSVGYVNKFLFTRNRI